MLLVSIISCYSSCSYVTIQLCGYCKHWGVSSKLCNINLIFTLSFSSINLFLFASLLYVELIVAPAVLVTYFKLN